MSINWIVSFKEGLNKAADEKKLVLLDFFNPN